MSDDDDVKDYPDLPRAEVEKYASDPTIASMLRKGQPLNRHMYLAAAWHGAIPEPWTYEHEHEVPACFRDSDAVKPD